ncbi:hypothetical protein ACFE04_013897 [Oxalis oulophora]
MSLYSKNMNIDNTDINGSNFISKGFEDFVNHVGPIRRRDNPHPRPNINYQRQPKTRQFTWKMSAIPAPHMPRNGPPIVINEQLQCYYLHRSFNYNPPRVNAPPYNLIDLNLPPPPEPYEQRNSVAPVFIDLVDDDESESNTTINKGSSFKKEIDLTLRL